MHLNETEISLNLNRIQNEITKELSNCKKIVAVKTAYILALW